MRVDFMFWIEFGLDMATRNWFTCWILFLCFLLFHFFLALDLELESIFELDIQRIEIHIPRLQSS